MTQTQLLKLEVKIILVSGIRDPGQTGKLIERPNKLKATNRFSKNKTLEVVRLVTLNTHTYSTFFVLNILKLCHKSNSYIGPLTASHALQLIIYYVPYLVRHMVSGSKGAHIVRQVNRCNTDSRQSLVERELPSRLLGGVAIQVGLLLARVRPDDDSNCFKY